MLQQPFSYVLRSTFQVYLDEELTQYQGRAGLVALRRSKAGVSSFGKTYYKGGFEKQMNKKEAALILETS